MENFTLLSMQNKISFILKFTHVIFWVIFIGLCIRTGAIIVSMGVSLFVNSRAAADLYPGLTLSELYHYSIPHYVLYTSMVITFSGLKAFLAWLTIKIFLKLDISDPFQSSIALHISKISYCSLITGVFAIVAETYTKWLIKKDLTVPDNWEGGEFLFLAGIIFIVAQVFRKGVELKEENELTI